jgi:hypothetical protein
MASQWDCFLQNLGEWQGSFTTVTPQGEIIEDIPSHLSLELSDQQVRLTLRRQGRPDLVLNFATIGGGGLMFFETGSFSQGSVQYAPYGQFGAELAIVTPNERLRLVQMFENSQLQNLTLIRETRSGTEKPVRSPLTVEALLGRWEGEAVTLFPDLRPPETYSTSLLITKEGSDRLHQSLTFGRGTDARTLTSTAEIAGSVLQFNQGSQPVQILFLPDGASSNCPTQIKPGQPFVLEVGWLVQPDLRQRLVRSYSKQGEWMSLTLVTERKAV